MIWWLGTKVQSFKFNILPPWPSSSGLLYPKHPKTHEGDQRISHHVPSSFSCVTSWRQEFGPSLSFRWRIACSYDELNNVNHQQDLQYLTTFWSWCPKSIHIQWFQRPIPCLLDPTAPTSVASCCPSQCPRQTSLVQQLLIGREFSSKELDNWAFFEMLVAQGNSASSYHLSGWWWWWWWWSTFPQLTTVLRWICSFWLPLMGSPPAIHGRIIWKFMVLRPSGNLWSSSPPLSS